MPTISLDLAPETVVPQIGTLFLVQELRQRLSRMSYLTPEFLEELENLEDGLRDAYASYSEDD
jgi:hypothetical protein